MIAKYNSIRNDFPHNQTLTRPKNNNLNVLASRIHYCSQLVARPPHRSGCINQVTSKPQKSHMMQLPQRRSRKWPVWWTIISPNNDVHSFAMGTSAGLGKQAEISAQELARHHVDFNFRARSLSSKKVLQRNKGYQLNCTGETLWWYLLQWAIYLPSQQLSVRNSISPGLSLVSKSRSHLLRKISRTQINGQFTHHLHQIDGVSVYLNAPKSVHRISPKTSKKPRFWRKTLQAYALVIFNTNSNKKNRNNHYSNNSDKRSTKYSNSSFK